MSSSFYASIIAVVIHATLFLGVVGSYAYVEAAPLPYPNNIVGIHLNQPEDHDIEDAAALVNSSGGDWGYVTIVVREDERDINRMNDFFHKLRKRHLIPIIRIEKGICGATWCRLEESDVEEWVKFLDSPDVVWPTKSRHVIIGNEVNHAQHWGGSIDVPHYTNTAHTFCSALKSKNSDFFVMMAGLDAAAPQQLPNFMDSGEFIRQAHAYRPELFDCLDGWSSHSYPNHGFVSSPSKRGKVSPHTYEWELDLLRQLGVNKEYCAYITEAGWPHREGIVDNGPFHSAEQVAQNYVQYITGLQSDPRVCAVTPFIINDQSELFDHFSFRLPGGEGFYPQYEAVANIPKVRGTPPQQQLINVKAELPKQMVANSSYVIPITLTNGGQAWWDIKDGYRLALEGQNLTYAITAIEDMLPNSQKRLLLTVKTGGIIGAASAKMIFKKGTEIATEVFEWAYEVLPPPSFTFTIGRVITTDGNDFTLQFFDSAESLVFEKKNVSVVDGKGAIDALENVVVGECYRVVVLKRYHLPRQMDCMTVQQNENVAQFEAMLPIDFDGDGQFTLKDIFHMRSRGE